MFEIAVLTNKKKEAYESFLEKCEWSLIQHSTVWRNVILDLEKDVPFFVIAKENDEIVGALPLYYYKCELGNLLTTLAWHSISGILCSERDASCDEIYKSLLDYSLVLAKDLNCIAVSVATNPFLDDKEYYLRYLNPNYVLENFIQYVNLADIFDEKGNWIHPNYLRRNSLTRNLKKAESQLTKIMDEQSQENVDEWLKIHEKRMEELDAIPIPKRMFDSVLRNMVPKGKGKFIFALHGEKMISGGLFIFNRRIMDIYMMSMDSDYSKLKSNYLLIDNMLRWAKEMGISFFNWQSSGRRNSGLYKWKEQWGSREGISLYLTKILGNISEWRELDYYTLQEAYKWHYVLPFNLLKSNSSTNFTTKDELTLFLQSSKKHQ